MMQDAVSREKKLVVTQKMHKLAGEIVLRV